MTVQSIIDRVRQYRSEHKLAKATFARMAGLHDNALRDIDSPDWTPRVDTLQRLEAVVDGTPFPHKAASEAAE